MFSLFARASAGTATEAAYQIRLRLRQRQHNMMVDEIAERPLAAGQELDPESVPDLVRATLAEIRRREKKPLASVPDKAIARYSDTIHRLLRAKTTRETGVDPRCGRALLQELREQYAVI